MDSGAIMRGCWDVQRDFDSQCTSGKPNWSICVSVQVVVIVFGVCRPSRNMFLQMFGGVVYLGTNKYTGKAEPF